MFKKILIANRGEIAVRVIRACHELGIAAVAVYSQVDRAALHVLRADEAYAIGPGSASESYLKIENLLAAAKRAGAEAIHPGYGFLSENAAFARACQDAGIKFIGPPATAMEIMGSKTRARQQMAKAGVSFVPGSSQALNSVDELASIALDLGYPIMLKAAAGGGGKGMRLVNSREELASAFDAARSEASRAFGDDEVYVEKAILNPRHIEIQVMADEHGNTVHLGERDCSVQRRHQKVLEEAPSPAVNGEMRRRMGEVAVRAAQAAGYTNAGTIEFLADTKGNFYFLEMNTRIQVEHPVTELVTGIDLVQLQIRIAAGEKLPFQQEEIQFHGHAMECRIYAEDPENNFFPSPGRITQLQEPSGPGVRVDGGVYEGWSVPLEYDPLLAKLIVYAESREQAIARLQRALREFVVDGVKTNLALFRRILSDKQFVAGKTDTGTLANLSLPPCSRDGDERPRELAAVAAGIFHVLESGKRNTQFEVEDKSVASGWKKASRTEAQH